MVRNLDNQTFTFGSEAVFSFSLFALGCGELLWRKCAENHFKMAYPGYGVSIANRNKVAGVFNFL